MFVHCAQAAEDIDRIYFAYDSPLSLLDFFKIWLTLADPFLPKFCPKVTPFALSVGDFRWQIVSEWLELEIVQ